MNQKQSARTGGQILIDQLLMSSDSICEGVLAVPLVYATHHRLSSWVMETAALCNAESIEWCVWFAS